MLERHPWLGNVRELLHVVERAMVVCEGSEILPKHLPGSLRNAHSTRAVAVEANVGLSTLEELERDQIKLAVEKAGGHRGNAAKLLGISERNLYRKLKDYQMLQ